MSSYKSEEFEAMAEELINSANSPSEAARIIIGLLLAILKELKSLKEV